MPAENDTQTIVTRVKQLLADDGPYGVHLALSGDRFDDDWLYLTVAQRTLASGRLGPFHAPRRWPQSSHAAVTAP